MESFKLTFFTDVNNVANNLTVKVLNEVLSEREVDLSKRVDLNIRDDLVGVSADVDNIANNLTVKVLSERNERDSSKRSSGTLVGVDVGKYRSYEIMVIIDTGSTGVDDILNNATVKVISE